MTISMIAAVAENGAIGRDNQLLWHLPNDLKFFKEKTRGHHVIMGRHTFQSLDKPLPNRVNIVVTRDENYKPEGCLTAGSLSQAFAQVQGDEEPFIVGGAQIYEKGMLIANRLYITRVHTAIEGDTHFPDIDLKTWQRVWHEAHPADERHDYAYTFEIYERRK